MRMIDADALIAQMEADAEHMDEPIAKMFTYAAINDVKHAPTIEERKTTIEFPHVFIAEGYDSIKTEDGETGFGVYDPENKQIFIAGAVPDEIFVKALLHELMHWVQDISGYAFNEDEANTFAENIYNTMESYIVARRWTPCSNRLPEDEDWYLVTVHPDYVYPNCRATDTLYWREGKWRYINDGLKPEVFPDPIIAWMNLPDAYEGYEEEEEEE